MWMEQRKRETVKRLTIGIIIIGAIASIGASAPPDKVDVCHKGHTINIAQPAVNAHLTNHGDTIGECITSPVEEEVSSDGPSYVPLPCEEDDPCWDCTTMGNQICGPVVIAAPVHYHAPSPTPAPSTHTCEWHMFDPYCD